MYQIKRYLAWIIFGLAFVFIVHLILRFFVEAYIVQTGSLSDLDYAQLSLFYQNVFIPHLIISLFIGFVFGVWSANRGLRFKTWEDRFLYRLSKFRGHWIILSYLGLFLIAFGIGSFFGEFMAGLSWWFVILGCLIEIPFVIIYKRIPLK
jgi:hypothetical protein